jgi:hypothetical protein
MIEDPAPSKLKIRRFNAAFLGEGGAYSKSKKNKICRVKSAFDLLMKRQSKKKMAAADKTLATARAEKKSPDERFVE